MAALPAFAQDAIVEEATAKSPEMINLLHQREWVRLDKDGMINGTLMTLSEKGAKQARIGAKIVVSKDGKALYETTSDEAGAFTLEGLEPGTYALQTRGDVTFAAYALHVLPNDSEHLATDLEVFACVIPAARATELIASDWVPADWQAAHDVYYRVHEKDPLAEEREFNNSPQVVLRNGDLVGRVSRPGWTYAEQDLTGTVAQIVRDGEVIRKAAVNKEGYYVVKDLEPGVYDLFVSGDDGYAVLAFEAVQAAEAAANKDEAPRFVATRIGRRRASNCLCCELICQPEVSACSTCEVVVEEVIAVDECDCGVDPCACGAPGAVGGGFAGGGGFYGGGGGGGFGGGLGGAGGVLGAAGLAVGIAAIADDDDDGFNVNLVTPLGP